MPYLRFFIIMIGAIPRPDLETPEALCTAPSDMDIFTYDEKTSTRCCSITNVTRSRDASLSLLQSIPIYDEQS